MQKRVAIRDDNPLAGGERVYVSGLALSAAFRAFELVIVFRHVPTPIELCGT